MATSYDCLKRGIDVTVAIVALALAFPVIVAIAILVRLLLGAPVLFRQMRPGRGGKPFELIKFRTMTNASDADAHQLPGAARLTRFGRVLRAISLDELPQLLNIIRGDMTIVGPRPLLMHYLTLYTPAQARRHEVRPGLTGWAQVNGRNNIDWDDRLAMDVWYVDHRSLRLDLLIVLKSILVVLGRTGISKPGHATMPEFTGTRAAPNAPNE